VRVVGLNTIGGMRVERVVARKKEPDRWARRLGRGTMRRLGFGGRRRRDGPGGPRGCAQEWAGAGPLECVVRAGAQAGWTLGGPRESWWAEGGFPFFCYLFLFFFYSSSNLNIVFESKIQIFNEIELMPKHNNSTRKYASACHATIKDPLRVLFYEDYASIKQK
jgi:hypothetical protein